MPVSSEWKNDLTTNEGKNLREKLLLHQCSLEEAAQVDYSKSQQFETDHFTYFVMDEESKLKSFLAIKPSTKPRF